MRIAWWISKATNTHSEYVMFIDFTATVVARTCLSVTLYMHCFFCVDPSWGWKRIHFPKLGVLYGILDNEVQQESKKQTIDFVKQAEY